MFKIIHIHSDSKFLFSIDKYQHESFDNTILFLGTKDATNINYHETAVFFEPIPANIDIIVDYLSKFDLVVFADLTLYNRNILLKLPKEKKILWWLFGYEFYSTRLDLMLSKKSIDALGDDRKIYKKDTLKTYLYFIKYKYLMIYNFYKYIKRVDYILMTSKEEYKFLKKHWIFMPKLMLIPFQRDINYKYLEKKESIILGNSSNVYNNHLDILDIIKHSTNTNPYRVKMFLSYGTKKKYYDAVVEESSQIPNVEAITRFLEREEFNMAYREASALVMNCYRQMALGNIFTAIENNCKIYLNDKNIVKKWLENEGFFIFSIRDFKKDFDNNNLKLSEDEARNNILQLKKIIENNTFSYFCQNLLKFLTSKS